MATWFEITYTGEPTEADYDRVAELAAQGFTSGQLINDEGDDPYGKCRYCGAKIGEEQPFGFWFAGDERDDADTRRYCEDAPDHLHAPKG